MDTTKHEECTQSVRGTTKPIVLPTPAKDLLDLSDQSQFQSEKPVKRYTAWFSTLQRTWKLQSVLFLGLTTLLFISINETFLHDDRDFESFDYETTTTYSPAVRVNAYARQAAPAPTSTSVLECFQVREPVLTPAGPTDETITSNGMSETTALQTIEKTESCSSVLMDYVFAYSYGQPFVGKYTPPSCSFNRVVMNFTVTSRGRQFDRLAIMYFGDSEVFRTSTAEPTANGIRWTYMKDMTEYLYFWKQPQTLIFDLGNLIDNTYTGAFNTTLTATFFTSQDSVTPAGMILPVSARKGAANQASVFTIPSQNATNTISLPRNVNRAVFTVSACGQAAEEFWWGNVLSSDTNTFADSPIGVLYGYSAFREVQIFIDGSLAGVQWPFPVIFTGGVVPGLWRPIVGIDAFDLREHEIDITPWLGVLCDGAPHTFEIKVAGIADKAGTSGTLTETVGASWYVTGKIFLWLDDASSITTGAKPTQVLPAPEISLSRSITQDSKGTNQTLNENTEVKRTLQITSTIKTQHKAFLATWSQGLTYSNKAQLSQQGAIQVNDFKITGTDVATGIVAYKSSYQYPLYCNQSYIIDPSGSGNFSLTASINRGLVLNVNSGSVFPTGAQPYLHLPGISSLTAAQLSDTTLTTSQKGDASYFGSPSTGTATGFGSTTQKFLFVADGPSAELYLRDVTAVNGTVTFDEERLIGTTVAQYSGPASVKSYELALQSPKQATGRGPGEKMESLVSAGGD